MRPQYRTVTLVQLLSHHTGLPHDIGDDAAIRAFAAARRSASLEEARYAYIARALQDPPVGPTSAANYSNTGLIVAAVIAERATGESYEVLMKREVFGPLGMTRTGFGVPQAGQLTGHVDGRPSRPEDLLPDILAPAGANVYLPLVDWARFCIDQMNGAAGRGKLLRPETYRLMQRPQPGGDFAMGWLIQQSARRGPAMIHSGSDGTWYALVTLLPDVSLGALVIANAGADMGGPEAAKTVLEAAMADPEAASR